MLKMSHSSYYFVDWIYPDIEYINIMYVQKKTIKLYHLKAMISRVIYLIRIYF